MALRAFSPGTEEAAFTMTKMNFLKVPGSNKQFFESWPAAFQSLFVNTHRNKGKIVIRV